MEQLNTYRSSLVHISSKDRTNARQAENPTSDFEIAFQNANEVESIQEIALHSISLCNAFPNVYGQKLYLAYVSGGVEVFWETSMPQGFYSASTLLPVLTTAINGGIGAPFPLGQALSIDPVTQQIVTFNPYRLLSLQEIASFLSLPRPPDTLNRILGAPNLTGGPSVSVALNGPQEIFVHVSVMADGNCIMSNGVQESILGSISLHDAARGQFAYHQGTDRDMCSINYYGARNIKSVHVQLRDAYGTVVPLAHNQDVSIMCKLFFV